MFAVRVPGHTFVLLASQVSQQANIRVQSLWRAGTARLVALRGDGWLRTLASGTSMPAARTRSSIPASFATLQTQGMPARARNSRDDVLTFASFRLQSIDTVLRMSQDGFPSQPSFVISMDRLMYRHLGERISMGIGHRTKMRVGDGGETGAGTWMHHNAVHPCTLPLRRYIDVDRRRAPPHAGEEDKKDGNIHCEHGKQGISCTSFQVKNFKHVDCCNTRPDVLWNEERGVAIWIINAFVPSRIKT